MKKFKKGDKVVMHSCYEADLPKYKGKIWTCQTDSYMDQAGQEVVFLEGLGSCFSAFYLTIVNEDPASQPKKQTATDWSPRPDDAVDIIDWDIKNNADETFKFFINEGGRACLNCYFEDKLEAAWLMRKSEFETLIKTLSEINKSVIK